MKCPDCKDFVAHGAPACTCGWSKKGEHAEDVADRHRCKYSYGGERCTAPATLFDSIAGMDSGYCRWHFWAKGREGYEIMKDLERNGIPKERDYIREEVVEQAKDYAVRPGEPIADWHERLRAARKAALGRLADKMRPLTRGR